MNIYEIFFIISSHLLIRYLIYIISIK
uniref:NADH dehydrogenase subunit 1 n=1 Tax=Heterorhabditis bacteriophora TaxID=37862 RepID=A0A1I7WDX3_HETBA